MNLTPLEIEIILHCHCSHMPFRDSPASQEAHARFLKAGLISRREFGHSYQLTPAGDKLVEMLCSTPFPVNKWIDPRIEGVSK